MKIETPLVSTEAHEAIANALMATSYLRGAQLGMYYHPYHNHSALGETLDRIDEAYSSIVC